LIAAGRPEAAPEFLKLAASSPYTFYGLIAERELGLDPAVTANGVDMGPDARAAAAADLSRSATSGQSASAMPSRALSRFLKADKRARRAAALAQIGQSSDAYAELRAALFGAGSDAARAKWRGLAGDLGLSLAAASAPDPKTVFDVASFQHPSLQPLGGYTQDPALVFAIVRQESGFNPNAASSAGALGLMQVTPATGALAAGLEANAMDPSLLLDPEVNLRLGQDALGRLLEESDGDLVKTIAAYNAGPRAVGRWLASMPQADSLLMLESLPAAETRDYVQRVMAGYWIYRRLFNQPAGSLDAAAGGARVLLAASDAPSPATAALLAPGVSQTVQSDPSASVAAPP
jgi:soluble lytic murein transglycosylase-like protein